MEEGGQCKTLLVLLGRKAWYKYLNKNILFISVNTEKSITIMEPSCKEIQVFFKKSELVFYTTLG